MRIGLTHRESDKRLEISLADLRDATLSESTESSGTNVHVSEHRYWLVRETIDQIHALEAAAKAPPAEEKELGCVDLPWTFGKLKGKGYYGVLDRCGMELTFTAGRDSPRAKVYRYIVAHMNSLAAKEPPAEEPETEEEWRKCLQLPLVLASCAGGVCIEFRSGQPLTLPASRDSWRGEAYRHFVKVVNERKAEKA